MTFKTLSFASILTLLLVACGNQYKLTLESPKQLKINQKLDVLVKEKDGKPIDSVRYYLDGNRLKTDTGIDISKLKLGKHAVSATVFYNKTQKQLTNTIYFLGDKAPEVYVYEVVNEYPHDAKAFTQGLEYHNGFLYESTGQNGESGIRKVTLETGEVVQKHDIDKKYFGEGMTIYGNNIYMLTWQNRKGFIFDLNTFEPKGEFFYGTSGEGWGLTHNTNQLIKSDGSERIWFLDPKTQKEQSFIEAYKHDKKIEKLNELEFINGKIYANIWQKNAIAIINPTNGHVQGAIYLKGLQEKAGQKGDENVLNGIAYDAENDRLFVTGKRWNKIFEIKIKKK